MLPNGLSFWSLDTLQSDLASYLGRRWFDLDGSRATSDPPVGGELEFLNVPRQNHVGILRSSDPLDEKYLALFWRYLRADNWNSADLVYRKLRDPGSREIARQRMAIRRGNELRTALDANRYEMARWHLKEILQLLKPEQTEPTMVALQRVIEQLRRRPSR